MNIYLFSPGLSLMVLLETTLWLSFLTSVSFAAPQNPQTNHTQQLGTDVIDRYCNPKKAYYGLFQLAACKDARDELHADPAWPNKKRHWDSRERKFLLFGRDTPECKIFISPKMDTEDVIGHFTLMDVEAGLIDGAIRCIDTLYGGGESYGTIDAQTGEPVPVERSWTMQFYAIEKRQRSSENETQMFT